MYVEVRELKLCAVMAIRFLLVCLTTAEQCVLSWVQVEKRYDVPRFALRPTFAEAVDEVAPTDAGSGLIPFFFDHNRRWLCGHQIRWRGRLKEGVVVMRRP